MICLLALIGFGILGIFSVSHRALAKEAFNCIFRRVTLRKCDTGFDKKMKMRITIGIMRSSPKLSRFTFKYFEAISWVFTILLITSFAFSAMGIYNLIQYGNCEGAHSNEPCVFNPTGGISCGSAECELRGCYCNTPTGNCTEENNFRACDGSCDCSEHVCG